MTAMTSIDRETAWQAILGRDRAADGSFVYGVTSTGVYCRPACPSRRPRRENIRLFTSPLEAEAAGFRECQRCTPKGAIRSERLVAGARQLLEEDIEEGLGLEALAARLSVSAGYLQRTFKRLTGLSPLQYAANLRAEALKSRLREGEDVTTATYAAGFGSISRVYEQAPGLLGMTPGAYHRGGSGMTVSFTTAESSLGRALMAATGRGVCFIAIADSDDELEAAIRAEYPQADIDRDDGALRPYVDALRDYLDSGLRQTSLPLDLRGSAFQVLVWRALQSIPAGETRSYREIAIAIGRPAATRAVARACATNPLPLVVPCHRAVRSNGDTGGYRWGVERKRALLKLEHET